MDRTAKAYILPARNQIHACTHKVTHDYVVYLHGVVTLSFLIYHIASRQIEGISLSHCAPAHGATASILPSVRILIHGQVISPCCIAGQLLQLYHFNFYAILSSSEMHSNSAAPSDNLRKSILHLCLNSPLSEPWDPHRLLQKTPAITTCSISRGIATSCGWSRCAIATK